MRRICGLLLIAALALGGCRSVGRMDDSALETWQQEALNRNLDGETAIALQTLANNAARRQHRQDLPDLARFIRENPGEQSAELLREILWESVTYCNVQFVRNPAGFVRTMLDGEIRCRTAVMIAEKLYLNKVAWKTPAEQQREQELSIELSSLCGGLPVSSLNRISLVTPDTARITLPDALVAPISEDPAEALQVASVIFRMPDEIRRQKMANENFYPDCLLDELTYIVASYSLRISYARLSEAERAWRADPSAQNLWLYRKWYYRIMLDISRLPVIRGTESDRQFINSMLLLQEGF